MLGEAVFNVVHLVFWQLSQKETRQNFVTVKSAVMCPDPHLHQINFT